MYRVKKDKTLLSDVNTERDVRFVLSQAREKAIKIHHATESDARIQRWPFLSPPQSFARAFTIEIIPSSSVDYFRLCLRTIASTLPLLSREIRFERILFRDIMKSLSLSITRLPLFSLVQHDATASFFIVHPYPLLSTIRMFAR